MNLLEALSSAVYIEDQSIDLQLGKTSKYDICICHEEQFELHHMILHDPSTCCINSKSLVCFTYVCKLNGQKKMKKGCTAALPGSHSCTSERAQLQGLL